MINSRRSLIMKYNFSMKVNVVDVANPEGSAERGFFDLACTWFNIDEDVAKAFVAQGNDMKKLAQNLAKTPDGTLTATFTRILQSVSDTNTSVPESFSVDNLTPAEIVQIEKHFFSSAGDWLKRGQDHADKKAKEKKQKKK